MHNETIKAIVNEIGRTLTDRFQGKVFQLSPLSLAIDFGLRKGQYFFVSVDPKWPRLYLIDRRSKDLEKQSLPLTRFAQAMGTVLGGAKLVSITKDEAERVVRLSFASYDVAGQKQLQTLVIQLTGRSANLFILDFDGIVRHVLRSFRADATHEHVEGQRLGDVYYAPQARSHKVIEEQPLQQNGFPTLSAAAENYYSQLEARDQFQVRAKMVTDRLRKQIAQHTRLHEKLKSDLIAHGEPAEHKRMGDLLLANVATAERAGNVVRLKDYYAESVPTIEIEVDEGTTLQDEAARYFARYVKSKRARERIHARLEELDRDLLRLREEKAKVETAIALGDETTLAALTAAGKGKHRSGAGKSRQAESMPGVRRYRSSDGYEILVGRAARDNDNLTFHLARGNDLWLHAGDYPGSHVIVRNPSRREIPRRTLVEAAQLAGKFSQASKDAKVVVHYTERKFVSKAKGAAPGMVRLSTFRSITVEPKENVERI